MIEIQVNGMQSASKQKHHTYVGAVDRYVRTWLPKLWRLGVFVTGAIIKHEAAKVHALQCCIVQSTANQCEFSNRWLHRLNKRNDFRAF